jgi:hypothetical protein
MFRKLDSRIRPASFRISPASPLALLALFVALGGGAYAASGKISAVDLEDRAVTKSKLDRNSVVTGKIRGGAVTRPKLRNGLINTAKLAPDSVTGPKVIEATLDKVPSAAKADQATKAEQADTATSADTATEAQSATSAQTAASVGPNGVDSLALQSNSVGWSELQSNSVGALELKGIVRRGDSISIEHGDSGFNTAGCNSGEQMLSGGAAWGGGGLAANGANLRIAYSYPLTTVWAARGYNVSGETRDFYVYVLCLAP